MAILQSCCFWRSVRKGSFACAIYMLVYSIIALLFTSAYTYEEVKAELSGSKEPPPSYLSPHTDSQVMLAINVLLIICYVLGVTTSLLLIHGLTSDNRVFLLPWVTTVVLMSTVDFGYAIYLLAMVSVQRDPLAAMVFTLDFFIITLNIYALLCVVSQYQEYRAGRGTAAHDAMRRNVSIRYQVPPAENSAKSGASNGARRSVTFQVNGGPHSRGSDKSTAPRRSLADETTAETTVEMGNEGSSASASVTLVHSVSSVAGRKFRKRVQFPEETSADDNEEDDDDTSSVTKPCMQIHAEEIDVPKTVEEGSSSTGSDVSPPSPSSTQHGVEMTPLLYQQPSWNTAPIVDKPTMMLDVDLM